jgi:long-chain acyl-CoA synthetase
MSTNLRPPNFLFHMRDYSSRIAIISETFGEISYQELQKYANTFSGFLPERALVLCICSNNLETVVGYLGALAANSVVMMVEGKISSDLLNRLSGEYLPEYIWVGKNRLIDFEFPNIIHEFGNSVLLRTQHKHLSNLHPQLSLLLPTSGSTGSPKYVRLSNRNISSNAESIVTYLDITAEQKTITTLPSSYSYGLSIINSHLLSGATICMTELSMMENMFWEKIEKHQINSFAGVPYTYKMLDRIKFHNRIPASLKTITQAGGKLSKDLCLKFAQSCSKADVKFFVMYGQTEATARMSYLPSDRAIIKAGSIGLPIPGGEFWLVNDFGITVEEPNVPGELYYRGDNVCMGYAEGRADLSEGDQNKGVLATGDIAMRDDEGFLYIVGRKKRFIKIFGNRINLDEIENQLNLAGFESACTGIDEKLQIFTTGKQNEVDISSYLRQNIGLNKVAYSIYPIAEIPRNASGKIQYSKLLRPLD